MRRDCISRSKRAEIFFHYLLSECMVCLVRLITRGQCDIVIIQVISSHGYANRASAGVVFVDPPYSVSRAGGDIYAREILKRYCYDNNTLPGATVTVLINATIYKLLLIHVRRTQDVDAPRYSH